MVDLNDAARYALASVAKIQISTPMTILGIKELNGASADVARSNRETEKFKMVMVAAKPEILLSQLLD